MAWYADLSPCDYYGADTAGVLRAIGWLERDKPYRKGLVDHAVYEKLVAISREPWQPSVFMGMHGCDLCQYAPDVSGQANIFLPGNGFLYVCPELIVHYMNAHEYAPPEDFCAAVLLCPPMRSMEYLKLVLANGGRLLARGPA